MNKWTIEENNLLKNNYGKMSTLDLSILLNRTFSSVESKITKLKLGSNKFWTKEEDGILLNLYPCAKKEEIFKNINKSWRGICHRANKLGLKRNISANNSNITFFDNWTHQMAYILGFIAADGCIYGKKSSTLTIGLSRKDEEHLEKIRDILAPEKKIYRSKEIRKNGKVYEKSALSIGSNYMCTSLISLGINSKKSFTLKFPQIPEEFLSSFILGYFDGDGCIKHRKKNKSSSDAFYISFVGNFDFLSKLSEILDTKFDLNKRTLSQKSNCKEIFEIRYSTQQAIKICKWMYGNSPIYLERKHLRYKTMLELKELK